MDKESSPIKDFFTASALIMIVAMIIIRFSIFRKKFQLQMSRLYKMAINYTPIRYCGDDLSHISERRLNIVARKTLVLDMDETLVQSYIEYHTRRPPNVSIRKKPLIDCDFSFGLQSGNVTVFVYKRPHVDFFLDRVSKWYNLKVFTAATENYASRILDYLDGGRNILNCRFYRNRCIDIYGIRAKFITVCHKNMANVVLLDDCRIANSFNEGNAIWIKPYEMATKDIELLCMLPFLDALRFTRDVRSVLGRRDKFGFLTRDLLRQYKYYT